MCSVLTTERLLKCQKYWILLLYSIGNEFYSIIHSIIVLPYDISKGRKCVAQEFYFQYQSSNYQYFSRHFKRHSVVNIPWDWIFQLNRQLRFKRRVDPLAEMFSFLFLCEYFSKFKTLASSDIYILLVSKIRVVETL